VSDASVLLNPKFILMLLQTFRKGYLAVVVLIKGRAQKLSSKPADPSDFFVGPNGKSRSLIIAVLNIA
jgi:hypothetical protein